MKIFTHSVNEPFVTKQKDLAHKSKMAKTALSALKQLIVSNPDIFMKRSSTSERLITKFINGLGKNDARLQNGEVMATVAAKPNPDESINQAMIKQKIDFNNNNE